MRRSYWPEPWLHDTQSYVLEPGYDTANSTQHDEPILDPFG